jgi:hypothetical protein
MSGGLVLRIEHLALTFEDAAGHEHRVRPIVRRAMAILQELAGPELARAGADPSRLTLEAVSAGPVAVDLRREGDEAVARKLAEALLAGLTARLFRP